MENKFTVRDFIVYLLTGFSSIIFLATLKWYVFIELLKQYQPIIKDYNTILLIFLVLSFYIVGHIIQSIDLIRYSIGRVFLKMLNKSHKSKIIKIVFYILVYDRVMGILYFKEIERKSFKEKVYYLQNEGKYSPSEYWNGLKDLFHGLETVSIIFLIYAFILGENIYGYVCLSLTVAFCLEGHYYSKEYVESVEFTFEISSKKDKSKIS